jgi:hypothetical protein
MCVFELIKLLQGGASLLKRYGELMTALAYVYPDIRGDREERYLSTIG